MRLNARCVPSSYTTFSMFTNEARQPFYEAAEKDKERYKVERASLSPSP